MGTKKKSPVIGASHSKVTCKVLENLTTQIYEENFIDRNRLSVKSFTRDRVFNFSDLIVFLLQKDNGSYQKEINSYFDSLGISPALFPSSSALCQARSKLSPDAFIELNRKSVKDFYSDSTYRKWKGYRILAVDGSTLQLPKHSTIEAEFGVHMFGPKADSPKSLARISYLYDVLNGLVLDSRIGSFSTSETDMAWEHLEHVSKNDVILFDRYYPSYQLIFSLKFMGVNFCFRMKSDWWTVVREFTSGKSNDEIVSLKIPSKYMKWAEENGIPQTVRVRLIRKKNKNGEVEVFCTSLLNEEKYKRTEVLKLYKERWNIEEGYKLIKSRLEVEDFSGTRSIVVKQDFYIKTLLLTINAIMCQKINSSKNKSSGRVININKTLGLSTTKKLFSKIALGWNTEQIVIFYTNTMMGKFNYSRKGQKCSRNKKCHSKYNMNYKTA